MDHRLSDLTLDGGQQAGWTSRSQHAGGQRLAAFGFSQLDVEGGLGALKNPPGVKVDLPVPTAEQSDNLLLRYHVDLTNLLTVCGAHNHCNEYRDRGGALLLVCARVFAYVGARTCNSPSLVTSTTNSPSSVPRATRSRSAEKQ